MVSCGFDATMAMRLNISLFPPLQRSVRPNGELNIYIHPAVIKQNKAACGKANWYFTCLLPASGAQCKNKLPPMSCIKKMEQSWETAWWHCSPLPWCQGELSRELNQCPIWHQVTGDYERCSYLALYFPFPLLSLGSIRDLRFCSPFCSNKVVWVSLPLLFWCHCDTVVGGKAVAYMPYLFWEDIIRA